jgi:TolB protein
MIARRTAPASAAFALAVALGVLTAVVLVAFVAIGPALASPQNPSPRRDPEADAVETLPQDDEPVTLVLEGNQRAQIRLAFPEVEGVKALGGDPGRAARELESTLRNDLEATRIFQIQGPWAFSALTLTGDDGHDFEQYRSVGNEIVLLGSVASEGAGRLVFEGRLYDLASGQAILAKRYRGPIASARRIAHTFADEVVQFLAGRRGIALSRIAFTSDRSGGKEIYLMDYDGANQRPITAHRSTSLSPTWHPNGAFVAYTSFVGGSPGIYRAELATGRKTALITEGSQNISPSYSPDGRRIVFSRALGANSEIFVADADGSNARRLTHTNAIDASPSWSPQGSEIAFTSSRAGNPHVYVMDAEGANVRRLSFDGNYNDGAAWSPEGDKLAYASRRRGAFDVAVTELASLDTRVLTRGPGSHEEPTFSPDGRRIAFTSARGGGKQIWVMDADGSNPQALTGTGGNESPAWSGYPPR